MKEKLYSFLRPRLAVLLAAALLAAYLPAMPAAQAAGDAPASYWEDQVGVTDQKFAETGTELDSYTYSNSDGTTETVTVDHDATLGSKKNPFSIPDEKALILFGKLTDNATQRNYYILDKPGGKYNMGEHTMRLPLMGDAASDSQMPAPSAPFQGVLIGNGASIENVYVNTDSTVFGLFGAIGEVGVEGVEVTDLTVSLTPASSAKSSIIAAGGLVGYVRMGVTLTNCTANVTGDLGGRYTGGLVGCVRQGATLTNCTANVTGNLTGHLTKDGRGFAGGLAGRVREGDATLTNCTANVTGELGGQYSGGLAGFVGEVETLTNCTAQAVITKQESGSYAPSGLVGERAELVTFEDANITTLRMGTGSSVSLELVNNTALTLDDSGSVLKATGNAFGGAIIGSVEVTSNGDAVIQVHGGSSLGGRTYTLTGVNGTLRLEDKTDETTPQYWVTADASFSSNDADPLAKGDKVDLLGAADNRLCTVAVEAGTGGSVSVTNDGPVSAGTAVTVTATPDSGYRFVNWTENGQAVSTEARYTFEVTASRTLTAVFQTITPKYTVTVKAGTGGSVTGGGTFDAGTKATVTATPESGYRFVNWTENGQEVSAEASYTFAVTASRTLTAVFQRTAPQYTVTVQAGTGGSAAGGGTFDAGTEATVTATPESGYRFVNWTEDGQRVSTEASYTFEVTASRTLTAVFELRSTSGGGGGTYTPPTTPAYPPTVERPSGGGGAAPAVSPSNPKQGDTVTVTPKPDTGYEADQITVTDRNGRPVEVTMKPDGTYTFQQPSGKVTIGVTYRPIDRPWNNPFTDVSEGSWYYEAVQFVQERGLMNGYSDGQFGPNNSLSRAQLAQILFNKEGRPGVNYLLTFSDVAGEAWYTEAIRWATSQGIVGGYGNGTFGPNDPITREQLAVMLWRYVGSPAATNKELNFADADKISPFALEAMRWAMENGILNGYGDGRLGPQGQATRAQVAQMLKNFIENQEEDT